MAHSLVLAAALLISTLKQVAVLEAKLSDVPSQVFIIGGNTTDIKQHPYQVSIWSDAMLRGSGALVAEGWVITTASIVIGFDADTLSVRAHSGFASSGGYLYNVSKVLVHPRFRFSNMTFDVALLRLTKPLMVTSSSRDLVTSRQRVPLARRPLPTNSVALLSGWGSNSMNTRMSDQLLQTTVRPVNITECQTVYKRRLQDTLFCAEAVDVYGPCWGDSGDLLVYEGRLHGLLSWNRGCYDEVFPSVFTDIHTVYRWVRRLIRRRVMSKSLHPNRL